MSFEGRIIEFLDPDHLRVGYVRKQEHDKMQLVDPKGRNLSVSGDRVVIVHRSVSETDFPAIARQISEKIALRQAEVDVELLWQSLGGKEHPLQASELGPMFFSEDTPEAASAVFRALLEDTLYFKRKGTQFVPRGPEQVSTELIRRQRQQEHDNFRQRATALITELVRKKSAPVGPEAMPIVDRIQNWLKLKNGDEVGSILEQVAGVTKARDAAYDILVRTGRIAATADRFLFLAGVEEQFSQAVLQAAARLTPFVHTPSREDYRNAAAFTIDDDDTLEVDDALTVHRADDQIVVGIHIADVSAFVVKGDPLDIEAANRSSTIYLPTAPVRMFPERLSTGLVSLAVGVDRPAYTVEVRFDENANQLGHRIIQSTLHVTRRLSYDEADAAIAGGDEFLCMIQKIAAGLLQARTERGAITVRRPELKVRVHGEKVHVKKIDPNSPSRVLVSEMMILANGLSADFASLHSLPVIFRTQEPREAVTIDETPAEEAIAFERLRKTFKRSRLSLTPGAHSGLGLTAYTQSSSPIRRYQDLVTQRQLTALLSGQPIPHDRAELLQILAHAETAEVEIRQIEERSTQYWLLQYLAHEKLNEVLPAVVLDTKGTVELSDLYFRAKIVGGTSAAPGARVNLRIESIDALKGELRLTECNAGPA